MIIELHSCTQANTASVAGPNSTTAPTGGVATGVSGVATGDNGSATGVNGVAAGPNGSADETWNATQPKFEAFLKGVSGKWTTKNHLDNGA